MMSQDMDVHTSRRMRNTTTVLIVGGMSLLVVSLLVAVGYSQPPEIGDPTQRTTESADRVGEGTLPTGSERLVESNADGVTTDVSTDAAASLAKSHQEGTPVQLPNRRQAVSEELRLAKRVLQDAKNGEEKAPEQLSQELELLKQIETVLAQLASAATEGEELRSRVKLLKAQAEEASEQETLTFLQLDHLRDELSGKQARLELIESSLKAATDALQLARTNCEEKAKALRLLKEGTSQKKATPTAIKQAELETRLCTESVALRKQQLDNETLAGELHKLETQQLQERIEAAGKVRFSADELQERLADLDKQEADLQRTLASLQSDEEYVERQLFEARRKLDSQTQPSPELREEVEAKRLLRQLSQLQVAANNLRLQQLSRDRGVWKQRFAVINETATTKELIQWKEDTSAALLQLERERRIQRQRIDEIRAEGAKRDALLQADATGDEVRRWVVEQQSTLQQLQQVHDRTLASLDASRVLHSKLLAEIEGDTASWSLNEWLSSAKHYASRIWDTELANVDDRPITIGKVVLGLFLIFCGIVMARLMSRVLAVRLNRFGMDQGGVSALQSVAFYTMLVVFTLTSLRFVNVPLTIFTLMGGAIAIGVGFGSQNILNNFISGLILLAERPIKVGDLIQLETLFGNIVKIGARSTQVRTGDNLDIIVPNSKFLENNVINLTLGDDKLRTNVKVGVAYGSPTRDVARLLERAANEHGQVLRSPRPFVWFMDFAENSLNFQLNFWVKARTLGERTRIESDLRFRIDQLFREAKITISFPQRDVHIDGLGPLDVRIMPGELDDQSGHREAA